MVMNLESEIAFSILASWGYYNVQVGDLDGRNHEADYKEHKDKSWYRPRDKSHKTNEAVKHAYRLADIAIERMKARI
jgi:hypothetical protein